MKKISINNGASFVTPEEALREISIDTLAAYMDDDVREQVHLELAPCTELEFLSRYLQLAKEDLII